MKIPRNHLEGPELLEGESHQTPRGFLLLDLPERMLRGKITKAPAM